MAKWNINDNNRPVYILVVFFLGIISIGCLTGIFFLSVTDKAIPESFTILLSVSVGALASLLPSASFQHPHLTN